MTLRISLPADINRVAAKYIEEWETEQLLERFWSKDPTVWADPPVPETGDRLGWLDAPTSSRALVDTIESLHGQAVEEGITDIVLCGMGGSSLAPEVFSSTLPSDGLSPKLMVIDSTHPGSVVGVDAATEAETTWYVIASKSGGTIETMSLFKYFWEQAETRLDDPGDHFIAITDPGTSLESMAADLGFRATIHADPDVGGRYSALTAFGLVPTGLIGGDVSRLLDSAEHAASLCGPGTSLDSNPGFSIGVVLAEEARAGNDKAHFVGTQPVETIGIWIEQLIAESTGKNGVGVVPIDGGPRLAGGREATVVSIGDDTTPTADIAIGIDDPYEVAGVMFILEFATAVAGRCLGINPFDQPDVQLAKKLAATAMEGGLGSDSAPPIPVSDPRWAESLDAALGQAQTSYVSIQAYVPQTEASALLLEQLRNQLTTVSNAYTTVGFGPRFLHSTGQLHKGGPAGGTYLQITDDTGDALDIPGAGYTFNKLIKAQATGDRAALTDRNRTVIAVDIGDDVNGGLASMIEQVRSQASGIRRQAEQETDT